MDGKSKLYSRAKMNNLEPPHIKSHIIKQPSSNNKDQSHKQIESQCEENKEKKPLKSLNNNIIINSAQTNTPYTNHQKQINKEPLHLPIIKNAAPKYSKSIPQQPTFKPTINHISNIENVTKQRNPYLAPYKTKNPTFKPYMKDSLWYTIVLFLPPRTLYNFMLVSKQFNNLVNKCDEMWYYYYTKKFKNKSIEYATNQSKWKILFMKSCLKLHKNNYEIITKKFLLKYKKNNYTAKKDHYFLSNNLFKHLKPKYSFEIDGKIFPVKHILSNKLLSHCNFYTNFDEHYQDMNKAGKLRLLLNDQSMGFYNKVLIEYQLKKIKFSCTENDGLKSKICKVFYSNELIISTFEKNFIFFINISLPICRICETLFDFLKGIHSLNLNYFCDSDSKFGLYDYSLLINLKSWNNIYYSLSVTTCDFKEDGNELYYINSSTVANTSPIHFDIKTICMNDFIENFLIFDLVLLTYNGDHVLCESKPLIIREDPERIDYDDYGSAHFYAESGDNRYKTRLNFNINQEMNYFALIYTELRLEKVFIERIFKKN